MRICTTKANTHNLIISNFPFLDPARILKHLYLGYRAYAAALVGLHNSMLTNTATSAKGERI